MFDLSDQTLMLLGGLLYLLAFAVVAIDLRRHLPGAKPLFRTLLICGFSFQSLGLYARGVADEAIPVQNFFEILQVISWSAVLVSFIFQPAFHLRFTDVLSAGLAGLLGVGAFAFDSSPPALPEPGNDNPWVAFHAVLAVSSYGIFAVLALTSLMYLLQHFALQRKRVGRLFTRLPAIAKLEEVNSRLILFGVTLFSVGVAIGALNLLSAASTLGVLKLAIALGVWASYAVLLYLRQSQRLFGAPFAWACLLLFVPALITLKPLTISTQDARLDPSITAPANEPNH
ncbi:MAG: cytochrome c biogenesis protein CcsA [Opitutales bacterium]